MGPALASAAARSDTVPAFRTNVSAEPPARTTPNAMENAMSAARLCRIALKTSCTMSRRSPTSSSSASAPRRRTTRKIPPTTGTARSTFSVDSATNWTATSGQFAAATSAPRLSVAFRPGAGEECIANNSLPLQYSALRVPSIQIRERRVSWRRLLAGGIIVTALSGIAGGVLELWRFGRNEEAAAQRVNAHVRQQFDRMVLAIGDVSARILADPMAASALTPGSDGARRLFDLVSSARRTSASPDDIAVTIYDAGGVARAWDGAPSDIPNDRISGSVTLFVTRSPLGLRLVHIQPIATAEGRRVGSVATEHELSPGSSRDDGIHGLLAGHAAGPGNAAATVRRRRRGHAAWRRAVDRALRRTAGGSVGGSCRSSPGAVGVAAARVCRDAGASRRHAAASRRPAARPPRRPDALGGLERWRTGVSCRRPRAPAADRGRRALSVARICRV